MSIEGILLGKFYSEKINGYLYFEELSENLYLYKKFLKTNKEHTDQFWNCYTGVGELVSLFLCGKKVNTDKDIVIAESVSDEFIKHLIYRKNGTFTVKSTNLSSDRIYYLDLQDPRIVV